jgi:hypothetical protein
MWLNHYIFSSSVINLDKLKRHPVQANKKNPECMPMLYYLYLFSTTKNPEITNTNSS